jgi:hypothetical protein
MVSAGHGVECLAPVLRVMQYISFVWAAVFQLLLFSEGLYLG